MFRLLAGVACALAAASPALAQEPGRTILVGRWAVSDTRSAEGRFMACATMVTAHNGTTFGFAVDDTSKTAFVLEEPADRFTPKTFHMVAVRVDGGAPVPSRSIAVSGRMLVAFVDYPDGLLQDFAGDEAVEITVDDSTRKEPLDGASDALQALQGCARRGLSG